MKISDILQTSKKTFSFEFFPPKTKEGEGNLIKAVYELRELSPNFVSVTYGALGTTQEKSLDMIRRIHGLHPSLVMAHYTCIGATEEKVDQFLDELRYPPCTDNILALRGDAPQGATIGDVLRHSPFKHAVDLVRYIRKKQKDSFSIGVAGYPEGHPECVSKEKDLDYLKEKVDVGADFIITQLFFDNNDFYRFVDNARKHGITKPIIAGIMPIENYKQIEKITSMGPVNIPASLKKYLQRTDVTEEEKRAFAISFTTKQCQELLRRGVNGLHFYTLNKSTATREIFKNIAHKNI
jgi:methylenetetrahydrofolate reductase (NADPH)